MSNHKGDVNVRRESGVFLLLIQRKNLYNQMWELMRLNKKDISAVRRQFKLDNDFLHIKEVFTVYVQKETGDIFHHMSHSFELLERDTQELFFDNFKKVLTGQLDTRLFELRFSGETREGPNVMHDNLLTALESNDVDVWKNNMLTFVESFTEEIVYDFDTVMTFLYGSYEQPVKRDVSETEEHKNDYVLENTFILCSINETSLPKAALTFDYIEKSFKQAEHVDPIIHLEKPMSGFLFPVFNEGIANVNHILYRTKKANEPDPVFVENVLQCDDFVTALEDKDTFEFMVNELAGKQMNATMIASMYEEIEQIIEESEENDDDTPMLNYNDVEHILSMSGVEEVSTEKVKQAFTSYAADENHQFKASNLLPKSVKIKADTTKITLQPEDLKHVKLITYQGKRCLLLEINEDVEIEGFQLDEEINL